MPVNLNELGAEVDDVMSSLREDLISAINDEKRHIDWYENSYLPSHYLNIPDEINTAIDVINDINISLQKVINTIDDYALPSRPEILDEKIERYNTEQFNHINLTDIQDALDQIYSSFNLSSGPSVSGSEIEAIQDAIYNYGISIKKEMLSSKIDDLAYSWAADGYQEVPGAMTYKTAMILNDFDISIKEQSNSIFFKIAQSIQDNVKSSIENGITIEKMHMDFANQYTKTKEVVLNNTIKAYTAEIEKILSEVKAPVKQITSIVKAFRIDNEIEAKEKSLNIKKTIAELKSYVEVTNAAISASVNRFNASVKASEALANSYGSLFTTYGSAFTGVAMEEQSADSDS